MSDKIMWKLEWQNHVKTLFIKVKRSFKWSVFFRVLISLSFATSNSCKFSFYGHFSLYTYKYICSLCMYIGFPSTRIWGTLLQHCNRVKLVEDNVHKAVDHSQSHGFKNWLLTWSLPLRRSYHSTGYRPTLSSSAKNLFVILLVYDL